MNGFNCCRDESLADWLFSFAPSLPGKLRLQFARKAASRGLGPPALRAAPDDPVVLLLLGMLKSAAAAAPCDRYGEIAVAAAIGALGNPGLAVAMMKGRTALEKADRRLIARHIAPVDPMLAMQLLPSGDHSSRAACALAAGEADLAHQELQNQAEGRRDGYLNAAIAAHLGNWRVARELLNGAFLSDELAAPLHTDSDLPMTLETFSRPEGLGQVDGPLVSVVMPTRDMAGTLQIAVNSLLQQTWRNIELLIIDDGSTDATAAVAADLADRDSRVRLLSNTRSAGAYGARNTGLLAARGDYIALHDADDWAHPQRLERQMRSISAGRTVTVCRYFRLDGLGRPVCPRVFPFVRMSPIAITTRAEIWSSVGLYEEAQLGADSEWLARVDHRFGRRAASRTREVGMVALWDGGSLSVNPLTGLRGEGLHRRVDYVEAWRRRHAAEV